MTKLPPPLEYQAAIQHPRLCFADAELRQGVPTLGPLGLPRVASGNFASVYQLTVNGDQWAIRCFHRSGGDLEERYAAIAAHLAGHGVPPCLVPCDYLSRGIHVGANWFPIVKMKWIEAPTLNIYVRANLENRPRMDVLTANWRTLAAALERSGVCHGDLQHGNILVERGALKLVDYDGLHVPALPPAPAAELGHPAFQHPKRSPGADPIMVDRFSALLIYTALRSLAVSPELWRRFDNGDNLLFQAHDLAHPDQSPLFDALRHIPDPTAVALVERLGALCTGPLTLGTLDDELRAVETNRATISTWWRRFVNQSSPPPSKAPQTQPTPSHVVGTPWRVWGKVLARGKPAGAPGKARTAKTAKQLATDQSTKTTVPATNLQADITVICPAQEVGAGELFEIRVGVRQAGTGIPRVPVACFYPDYATYSVEMKTAEATTNAEGEASLYPRAPILGGPLTVEVRISVNGRERCFAAELHVRHSILAALPSWLRPIPRLLLSSSRPPKPVAPPVPSTMFVANPKSNRFHRADCGWARRVPANRVLFQTVDQARAAGFLPCRVCRPA